MTEARTEARDQGTRASRTCVTVTAQALRVADAPRPTNRDLLADGTAADSPAGTGPPAGGSSSHGRAACSNDGARGADTARGSCKALLGSNPAAMPWLEARATRAREHASGPAARVLVQLLRRSLSEPFHGRTHTRHSRPVWPDTLRPRSQDVLPFAACVAGAVYTHPRPQGARRRGAVAAWDSAALRQRGGRTWADPGASLTCSSRRLTRPTCVRTWADLGRGLDG